MLLKITEKIIQRNVFEQKKMKPRLAPIGPFTIAPCRTSIAPVKQKVLYIYAPDEIYNDTQIK